MSRQGDIWCYWSNRRMVAIIRSTSRRVKQGVAPSLAEAGRSRWPSQADAAMPEPAEIWGAATEFCPGRDRAPGRRGDQEPEPPWRDRLARTAPTRASKRSASIVVAPHRDRRVRTHRLRRWYALRRDRPRERREGTTAPSMGPAS